jgi:hypothetical protein
MFSDVLKKFFTPSHEHENKEATRFQPEWFTPMIEDLKSAFSRAPATLPADMAGAAALVILVIAALHLPGLV